MRRERERGKKERKERRKEGRDRQRGGKPLLPLLETSQRERKEVPRLPSGREWAWFIS
ncbi:hypothetical protein LEMLEM_LOCUS8410, partial [Lemmus lemmus]